MDIKKCDRCGDNYEHNTEIVVKRSPTTGGIVSLHWGVTASVLVDLCERCASEFKSWFNNAEREER